VNVGANAPKHTSLIEAPRHYGRCFPEMNDHFRLCSLTPPSACDWRERAHAGQEDQQNQHVSNEGGRDSQK